MQRDWFLAVNQFAQSTPVLHAPMRIFAEYGVALFAVALLLAWWTARRDQEPRTMAAALWAPAAVLLAVGLNQLLVNRLVVGDITLDPLEQRVWVADTEVTLSRREFAMLTSLMESRGHVVSRFRLYDDVWEGEVDIRSNALDVHMSRLRYRLEASDQVMTRTVRAGRRIPTGENPEMTHV